MAVAGRGGGGWRDGEEQAERRPGGGGGRGCWRRAVERRRGRPRSGGTWGKEKRNPARHPPREGEREREFTPFQPHVGGNRER